eukprot:scaffold85549_cov46-Phaeocystis_antarctica.AAC.2
MSPPLRTARALRLVPARPTRAAAARARQSIPLIMYSSSRASIMSTLAGPTPAATRARTPRARLAALTSSHSLTTTLAAVMAPARPAGPT